jgi:hypothetical protein
MDSAITEPLTPNMIREKGIKALTKELGPVGMTYFIQQFDNGRGDYTKERAELLAGITREDVERQLKQMRQTK